MPPAELLAAAAQVWQYSTALLLCVKGQLKGELLRLRILRQHMAAMMCALQECGIAQLVQYPSHELPHPFSPMPAMACVHQRLMAPCTAKLVSAGGSASGHTACAADATQLTPCRAQLPRLQGGSLRTACLRKARVYQKRLAWLQMSCQEVAQGRH